MPGLLPAEFPGYSSRRGKPCRYQWRWKWSWEFVEAKVARVCGQNAREGRASQRTPETEDSSQIFS